MLQNLQSVQHRPTLWAGVLRPKHNPEAELSILIHLFRTCSPSLRRSVKEDGSHNPFTPKWTCGHDLVLFTHKFMSWCVWSRETRWEQLSKRRASKMAHYKNLNLAIVATKKRGKTATQMHPGLLFSLLHTHTSIKTRVDLRLVWKGLSWKQSTSPAACENIHHYRKAHSACVIHTFNTL